MKIHDRKIHIGKKIVSIASPVFVIAEAGVNHNGKLNLALKMVDVAATAGADAIKFQTFKAEDVVMKDVEMADYQEKNTGKNESQLAMLKRLEFKEAWYPKVIERCRKRGIIFLSTPHGGFDSVDLLQRYNVSAFKFGSGDLTNLPVIEYAAKYGKPIILSTGMANMAEIKEAVRAVLRSGNQKLIVLHATTNYPAEYTEVNLLAIKTLQKELKGMPIGFSDHTTGTHVAVASVALGSRVLEKHFTLSKKFEGPDHVASLEPDELQTMISSIRNIERAMGNGKKIPFDSEKEIAKIARKSLVVARNVLSGGKITTHDIAIKRPGTGIEPKFYNKLLGRVAKKNLSKETLYHWKDLV